MHCVSFPKKSVLDLWCEKKRIHIVLKTILLQKSKLQCIFPALRRVKMTGADLIIKSAKAKKKPVAAAAAVPKLQLRLLYTQPVKKSSA